MSLPVRKSCGIVDSVSFLTLASICASPPPLLTSLSSALPPSPFRLDTDGIDLLMSFLRVSIALSARHECYVKNGVTHLAAMLGLFICKEAHQGASAHTHAITQC